MLLMSLMPFNSGSGISGMSLHLIAVFHQVLIISFANEINASICSLLWLSVSPNFPVVSFFNVFGWKRFIVYFHIEKNSLFIDRPFWLIYRKKQETTSVLSVFLFIGHQ